MTKEQDESTSLTPWILMLPFAEQVFCLILFVVLAPSVWGIYLLYRGHLLFGFSVLSLWTIAFARFAIFVNHKKLVRFWISIPVALLVVFSAIYVFFSP
jgi:hypothetical protein